MAENSAIEWTDHTFNPWIGCTKVSPGCDHCYAENRMDTRFGLVEWGAGKPRKRTKTWGDPVKWNAAHEAFFAQHGRRQRVFCASLADVFDNEVDPEWRHELFNLVRDTPNLDWLLLTKRIGNAERMVAECGCVAGNGSRYLPSNARLGATITSQPEADRDIPKLLAARAALSVPMVFLSMEPLLGPVYLPQANAFGLHGFGHHAPGVDWVIVGGESGPGARPMHPDWARSLRDQCAAAGVPFLFKQWGEWLPWSQFSDAGVDDPPEQTRFQTREHVDGEWRDVGRPGYWDSMDGVIDDQECVGRVGKKAAGRLLDGRTHDGFPEVQHG